MRADLAQRFPVVGIGWIGLKYGERNEDCVWSAIGGFRQCARWVIV